MAVGMWMMHSSVMSFNYTQLSVTGLYIVQRQNWLNLEREERHFWVMHWLTFLVVKCAIKHVGGKLDDLCKSGEWFVRAHVLTDTYCVTILPRPNMKPW